MYTCERTVIEMCNIFRSEISVLVCLCLFSFGYVSSQVQQQVLNKLVCIEHEECGACLSAASHCRWCADPYFKGPAPRCDDEESLVAAKCSQEAIQRPMPTVWDVAENRSLQDVPPGSLGVDTVVQIQPQRVHLSIKPRETRKVKFTYRPARNYPLDLYYLMDLTYSMKDDKETLVSLRDDLPQLLQNLTANFKLGFGSFAEKPVMPFINTDKKRRENPCGMDDYVCLPTYSYKHHLSLTDQVEEFISNVNRSSVTANLDNAEAQLDALVQAVTCGDRIGWAEHSRKIILILTDGLMHTAGDGRLGGATMRNDEKCHLDENGYYSDAMIYDYPSIAQVFRLLDEYKVNVIFAITSEVKSHYDSLHQLLEDFTYVARLESDSSNILKVVKTGYEDIVSVVDFEDDANLGPVRLRYFTDCGVSGGPMIENTKCSGVEYGMTLNYEVYLTLDRCPEYKMSTQTIRISESQLGQDSLTLEVDIQCGCNCESQTEPTGNVSTICGFNKHLVCGICLCNEGWSGPNCDCSIKDEAASAALDAQCREPNATRNIPCSGAGDCVCGKCYCDLDFSGKYCQCTACEVALDNGLECGGVERGVCACGRCACAAGWQGDACDCATGNDACIAPGSEQVCSGHGDCVCGKCQCSAADYDDSKYTGVYCETCKTCKNPLCATAEPCVACYLNSTCTDLCTIGGLNYTVTERMNETEIENEHEISCIYRGGEEIQDCQYKYTYTTGTKESVAMEIVLRSKFCPTSQQAAAMTWAFVIIGCIVLAGLVAIMVVKSGQIISDRRAYAKFYEEAMESRKHMAENNPLYISPISEFRLPDSYPRNMND